MDNNYSYLALALAASLPAALSYLSKPKYHPGPTPLPLLGNLPQVLRSRETPWLTYKEWSKIYGPCVHLEVVGQHVLILNDVKDAEELLSKRGPSNSERPHLVMAGDLVGFGRGLALLPYDRDAREARKLIHLTIGTKNLSTYNSLLEEETLRYVRGLRDTPEDLLNHLKYSAGAVILKIAYGYDVEPKEDPLVILANEALDKFSRTTMLGEFPVDLFPILRYVPSWVPGIQFKRLAEEWSQLSVQLFDRPFEYVKEQMLQGTAIPSFSSKQLETIPEWNDHVVGSRAEVIKATAVSLYAGGSDTTVSAMQSFFLAMAIHPELQAKAQEEIDTAVGTHRLPNLSDRKEMPFCDRLIKEVLRWGVVGPLGVPHVSNKDDKYGGYFIPKGTVIVANIWAMLHDERLYPEPAVFTPDRFLDSNQPDPALCVFGFGRRACPGSHLAQASLFLSIAQTLALFDIKRIRDQSGNEVIPSAEWITGTISRPKPFLCNIVPREGAPLHLIA